MNLFITGSDTHVGKTFITQRLVALGLLAGLKVALFKPVQTGSSAKTGDAADTAALLAAHGIPTDALTTLTGYAFDTPAAPVVASLQEPEKSLPCMETLLKQYKQLASTQDWVIVEGCGGVYCPLRGQLFVADLIRHFQLHSWLVVPPRLGAINHTLLSLEGLFQRGANCEAVLINEVEALSSQEKAEQAYQTLAATLETYAQRPILQHPFTPSPADALHPEALAAWQASIEATLGRRLLP